MATEPKEFTGQRPHVNEAREFIEIAKDFKRPQELLREALSNSWDANASAVSITIDPALASTNARGRKKQLLNITIQDDGEGMDATEIGYFFNLGDSHKPAGSIGTKGHGTKIYYKSAGIHVTTHKDGNTIVAETEMPPWDSLKQGTVPTYRYKIMLNPSGSQGTTIRVNGFDSPHSEFEDLNQVTQYLRWHTIAGSLQRAILGHSRPFLIKLKLPGMTGKIALNCDFELPDQQVDISKGTSTIIKAFPSAHLDAGSTSEGVEVAVDVLVYLLGDESRSFIPDTYRDTGIWLCKDFIMIERNNRLWEDVAGGQYYYRSFLAFANCQQFDLTANRNDVRQDEAFDLAIDTIKKHLASIWRDRFVQTFFETKSNEDSSSKRSRAIIEMDRRLQDYEKRARLEVGVRVPGIISRIPQNEAETLLVLQAMISAGMKSVDFVLGEYSAQRGTDAIIEFTDKGVARTGWLELVHTLAKFFAWEHNLDRIQKVVCWELGEIKDTYILDDGTKVRYEKAGKKHVLLHETAAIPVYVLSELLKTTGTEGD